MMHAGKPWRKNNASIENSRGNVPLLFLLSLSLDFFFKKEKKFIQYKLKIALTLSHMISILESVLLPWTYPVPHIPFCLF